MKTFTIALAFSLVAASASAEVINVAFTGKASYAGGTTANTGLVDGQTVNGAMQYNTVPGPRGLVTFAELAGFRAPIVTPQLSGLTPDRSEALYKTGTFTQPEPLLDTNFTLLLTSNVTQPKGIYPTFPVGSTLGSVLLTQLGHLDLSGGSSSSVANYSSQDASGRNVTRVFVYLTGVTASVPEPAPVALVGAAAGLLAVARRRRG